MLGNMSRDNLARTQVLRLAVHRLGLRCRVAGQPLPGLHRARRKFKDVTRGRVDPRHDLQFASITQSASLDDRSAIALYLGTGGTCCAGTS